MILYCRLYIVKSGTKLISNTISEPLLMDRNENTDIEMYAIWFLLYDDG